MSDPWLLQPTLWRTCRVLANETRLRILAQIMRAGPAHVAGIMQSCGLSEPKASQHLRLLQSRGLLAATRISRYVSYDAKPDPSVGHAADFLEAMRASLRRRETPAEQIRAFTAFTHPRRILIVRALAEKAMDGVGLAGTCHISLPALHRHLRKLERRGLVRCPTRGDYELVPGLRGLPHDLLRMATAKR